jgi:hypothetical protein
VPDALGQAQAQTDGDQAQAASLPPPSPRMNKIISMFCAYVESISAPSRLAALQEFFSPA